MRYPLIMVFIHEGLKYFTRYCVQILAGSRIFMVNVLFEKMVGFMEVLLFWLVDRFFWCDSVTSRHT